MVSEMQQMTGLNPSFRIQNTNLNNTGSDLIPYLILILINDLLNSVKSSTAYQLMMTQIFSREMSH